MNITKSIPALIITRMQKQKRDTAEEITKAIALMEIEETINKMCCDDVQ